MSTISSSSHPSTYIATDRTRHGRATSSTVLLPMQEALEDTTSKLRKISISTANFKNPRAVSRNVDAYISSLSTLQNTLSPKDTTTFPANILDYIENGISPDMYTKDMVEMTMRNQQSVNGKQEAYMELFGVLANEIEGMFPELAGVVEKVRGTLEE